MGCIITEGLFKRIFDLESTMERRGFIIGYFIHTVTLKIGQILVVKYH